MGQSLKISINDNKQLKEKKMRQERDEDMCDRERRKRSKGGRIKSMNEKIMIMIRNRRKENYFHFRIK